MVCALFDNGEDTRLPEEFPHLGELPRQQPPEKRADAYIREIIAPAPDLTLSRTVVAELRMIERLLHEPGKRPRPCAANRIANEANKIGIAGVHGVVKKVKRLHGYKGRRRRLVVFRQ